jgi:hypothetical protein
MRSLAARERNALRALAGGGIADGDRYTQYCESSPAVAQASGPVHAAGPPGRGCCSRYSRRSSPRTHFWPRDLTDLAHG